MNNLSKILVVLLVAALGIIIYQNFISSETTVVTDRASEDTQLYTCGMHPDIISDEPGNCPICEMKLTPLNNKKKVSGEREILYWVAPMDPNERYNEPGKSKMGMDLVPVYEDEVAGGGIVEIDPVTVQNMNVKLYEVQRGKLSPVIHTNGILETNEQNEYHVNSRTDGWVEKLNVDYTGKRISKGETLLEIYSPKLISAQKEYLAALKFNKMVEAGNNETGISGGTDLVDASYEKLIYLGMSPADIMKLENNGEVMQNVPVKSPASGTVLNKKVVAGQKIMPGELLFHIADLSSLWIIADVYENEIGYLKEGATATVKINGSNIPEIKAPVSFIYPSVQGGTHTFKIRIPLQNRDGRLKPGMIADVSISTGDTDEYPVVPSDAVILSGNKRIVILALGNGKFKPVEIKTGSYSDGKYVVTEGLTEGMKIITSAQFMIDSESNLKAALNNFTAGSGTTDTEMEMPENDMEHEGHDHQHGENQDNKSNLLDVESFDKNGDGMLFQCPMDWDVLSDESGRCPLCEMKLKEFSIDEVKANLDKHGYDYKKEVAK